MSTTFQDHVCFIGLPGTIPSDYRMERFWYTVVTLGQLQHRLLKPYQRLPLSMAALVDTSHSRQHRINLAAQMMQLRPCCVDIWFSAPVLECIRDAGGPESVVDSNLSEELSLSFRGKVSNMEIELNFARAACSRHATHGKSHGILAMVAKHVSAECKVGQYRRLKNSTHAATPKSAPHSGATDSNNNSFIQSVFIYVVWKSQ